MDAIRPRLQMFSDEQIATIVEDALAVLSTVGFEVENAQAQALLREAGVREVGGRFFATESAVRSRLATVPPRVVIFDRDGEAALDLGADRVHFDPGSAAIHFLDPDTCRHRPPLTADLCHLAWVTAGCRNIAGQSTGLVPADVPEEMGDRWRLYVALLNCRKPVITGTFRKDGFDVMKGMLAAVRGSEALLAEKPLAIFDCCPSPPLKWSDLTCQALVDCARARIPAELVSMPLGGATSPVTLREMVVQHAAESLSGVLLHQLACPGAPIVWGGSPAAFDMRHGTTPMGAIETMMVDAGYAQVGKHLGMPTHAYMGMSDAKVVDWQAGMESGLGAVIGALAGVNLISGPGMLDFESCQSLEKLVLDDQLAGMALRLVRGVSHDSAPQSVDLIRQVVQLGGFLGHRHTRDNFRKELFIPSRVIERGTYDSWEAAGASDAARVARDEVRAIVARGNPSPLPERVADELGALIRAEARRVGVTKLPIV